METAIPDNKFTIEHDAGMTLLEVLVAMGLVFVAVLALAGLTTTAMKGASLGKHMTIATTLAQEKLEDIKREGYHRNPAGAVNVVETYETIPEYPLYQRTTNIRPNTPMPGLQTVLVSVAWADDQHAVTLSTLLAE